MALVLKYFDIIGPCNFKWFTSITCIVLIITHIWAIHLHTHIHSAGSTTVLHIGCTRAWSWQPVSWGVDANGKYSAWSRIRTHISCHSRVSILIISQFWAHDAIICLPVCGTLPERSVQTITYASEYYELTSQARSCIARQVCVCVCVCVCVWGDSCHCIVTWHTLRVRAQVAELRHWRHH